MASVISPTLILAFLTTAALLISPSYSLNCNSQKFKSNKVFSNCTDLPHLNCSLHLSYNSTNSSLSIAFAAAPVTPEGWVAWGINPSGTGMLGSQSLVAFKSNGSLIVNTYNISTISPPWGSKLAFDVWDLSAETDGGNYIIFATVKVPEKAKTLNQLWQVGRSVCEGLPDKHAMEDANLNSKGILNLEAATGSGAGGAAPSGISRVGKSNLISVIGFSIYYLFCAIIIY